MSYESDRGSTETFNHISAVKTVTKTRADLPRAQSFMDLFDRKVPLNSVALK